MTGLPRDEDLEREAEQLAEVDEESGQQRMHIGRLQKKTIAELHELAKTDGITEYRHWR